MKKLAFAFVAIMTIVIVSCGGRTTSVSETDSVAVDSCDTTVVDTVTVDTVTE